MPHSGWDDGREARGAITARTTVLGYVPVHVSSPPAVGSGEPGSAAPWQPVIRTMNITLARTRAVYPPSAVAYRERMSGRAIPSLLLVLTAALVSCGPCDPEGHARALAGPGALYCGFVFLGDDRSEVLDCAEAAIDAGEPFLVGYQSQGRDSDVRYYAVGDEDGEHWLLGYDGGVPGGRSRVSASRCGTPPTRAVNALGEEHLTCPSVENVELCEGQGP